MQKHKVKTTKVDSLKVQIYDSSFILSQAAPESVANKGHANLIFASENSQLDFLRALQSTRSIDWRDVTTFQLDEYIGISPCHRASFRKYFYERIIDEVQPRKSFFLHGDAKDILKEIKHYENLLKAHLIDIVCIGIGENGHLAFNDPPVAGFEDPRWVKVVDFDERSRQQQVDEGWFEMLDEVPKQVLTMTIPAFKQSKTISCVVPDQWKPEAIYKCFYGLISTKTPALVLRRHLDPRLFLDRHLATRLKRDHSS